MKLQLTIYGQETVTFGEDALVKVRLQQKADLQGGALPEVVLEAVLRSETPLQLQNEQKLELYRGDQLHATVYVAECTRLGAQLYRLQGRRQLEFLQTEFLGGMYAAESPDGLLEQVLEGRAYELAIPLSGENVTGYLPRCNRQEAIRQLAVGMGAVLCAARDGALWFRAPEYEDPLVLEAADILGEPPLQMLPEYTRFELAAHCYTKGQLPVKLRDRVEYPGEGVATVYVSTPHYNFYTDPELGIYVQEEGPNYALVEHHGVLTLFAYPYVKETTYHTLPGRETEDYSLVKTQREVTLIHSGNVQERLARMQTLGQLRLRATVRCGETDGLVLPQAGDPVTLPTAWGTVLQGYVEKSDLLVTHDSRRLELTVLCREGSE